ncbi:MAG: DUF3972 domain-containing protein [Sulfurospirillaceae bacterium]|nr:DUF3972 domain-containing protein [Sulfurospirillaceae bacterium]MDD3462902.1 DUF3972 domain-containing protein [Sulfurospirillaceae bacterium]
MQTWLEIEEFSKLTHLDIDTIREMIQDNKMVAKTENGKQYIEVNKGVHFLMPIITSAVNDKNNETVAFSGAEFVEKTIGTILSLHEKVIDAKDETLDALKGENRFLKEALFSMQELYDEDRKTIEVLSAQLKQAQEELEFARRKYKLMWNKAVDNYVAEKK